MQVTGPLGITKMSIYIYIFNKQQLKTMLNNQVKKKIIIIIIAVFVFRRQFK